MKVTWYPKNLLLGVALVIAFAVALTVAIDFRAGATAGLVGLLVYVVLDVGMTFNPAQWWHQRDHRNHR